MIDFHSHILPGIDDGAKNSRMSLEMLSASLDAGVSTIIATLGFIVLLMFIIIPQLEDSIMLLVEKVPVYYIKKMAKDTSTLN